MSAECRPNVRKKRGRLKVISTGVGSVSGQHQWSQQTMDKRARTRHTFWTNDYKMKTKSVYKLSHLPTSGEMVRKTKKNSKIETRNVKQAAL